MAYAFLPFIPLSLALHFVAGVRPGWIFFTSLRLRHR
jgi:hypothetical protein